MHSNLKDSLSRLQLATICQTARRLAGESPTRVPDAVALEDRLLFSAAPLDPAAVAAEAGAPSTGAGGIDADNFSVAPDGGSAAAAANAPELFAPDRSVSVNASDRIAAKYSLGGTPNPLYRNLAYNLPHTGWEVFIEEQLQPIVDAGVSRIELHTPFGPRSYVIDPQTGEAVAAPGEWGYQFDAYLDAQVEVPKVTEDFVSAFQDFFAQQEMTGQVQEVIAYIGSPRLDPDQTALADRPDLWWDRAYDVLIPMFEAGFRSIGFDASANATPDVLDYELHNVLRYPELRDPVRDARLIEVVGDERIEVYLEAVTRKGTGRSDFPLLLLDWAYVRQDPERPDPHFESHQKFYEHDRLTGEVIRIVRHEQLENEGVAPIERILLEGNTAAVAPSFFLRPERGGAETLDEFVDSLDLPSLPTLVDLDPDDVNASSAEYEITKGPRFGTLTPNRFHADVFTYTPDPYFTGVDSLEYVVRDASGGTATATVQFFVNTDVVVPEEPAPPPVTPPVDAAPPPASGPAAPPVTTPVDPPAENPPAAGPGSTPTEPTGGRVPGTVPTVPDGDHAGPANLPVTPSRPDISPTKPDRAPPMPIGEPADAVRPSEIPTVTYTAAEERPPAETADAPATFFGDSTETAPADGQDRVRPRSLHAAAGFDARDPATDFSEAFNVPQLAASDLRRNDAAHEPQSVPIPSAKASFVYLPHANRIEGHATSSVEAAASQRDDQDVAELEGLGLVVGALAMERIVHPREPAVANDSSSVLRFLRSGIRNWLPRR